MAKTEIKDLEIKRNPVKITHAVDLRTARPVTKESLLEKLELAHRANGGKEFNERACSCDASVGFVPCEYCAIRSALEEAWIFVLQQGGNGERGWKKDDSKINTKEELRKIRYAVTDISRTISTVRADEFVSNINEGIKQLVKTLVLLGNPVFKVVAKEPGEEE